jgi:hypothetical protein
LYSHVNIIALNILLQNVEISVDPLIMPQQISLTLALWQMQPHAVQLALPMPTANFGFSTQKPMLYQLKPNFASSSGTWVSVIPCQLGQQFRVQKAVPSSLQTPNRPSFLIWSLP